MYGSPSIRGVNNSWMFGGLTVFLLMSPLHAETTSLIESTVRPVIQWNEWGPEAFHRAQAEDKLILLNLTAVWCHACHVMDRTTYTNPRIIQLLNTEFISIRIDTDQRPDLDARYRSGGWPTTSLLLPTGEILFQANALEPEEMEVMLLEVQSIYATDKAALLEKALQLRSSVKEKSDPSPFTGRELQLSIVGQSVEIMKNQFDAVNGGFRNAPKFFEPEAIRMAFTYGFFENDPVLIKMGLDTLEKQISLFDPVWGGFYRYAEQANWSQPHFEKMLSIQAKNLRNYVEAYQLTGDLQFKRVALALIKYVSMFLTDTQTGLFYESQDADVHGDGRGSFVPGAEYYSLSESKRLALGIPRVDQRIFTGSNALMARAYLHASPVLEKPEIEEIALRTLTRMFDERFDAKRGLAHGETESVLELYAVLSDHIYFGQALLEAFSTTGQSRFLQYAEALAAVTSEIMQDTEHGGFFDHPPRADKLGLLNLPQKPVTENFQAVLWYLTLFHLTEKQAYQSIAERTLQSIVTSQQPLPIALAGLAVDQWFRSPIHIAVVGVRGDSIANALWLEGLRLYCPGKIVKRIDPQEGQPKWDEIQFPYDGRAVAFVCTDRMCSAPAFHPEDMKKNMASILAEFKEPEPKK